MTVFLTTQYLDEADQLAGRIAVLNHGRLVAEGTPEELKRMIPGGHVSLRLADAESLRRAELVLDGATADPAPAGALGRQRGRPARAAGPAGRRGDRGRHARPAHPGPGRRAAQPPGIALVGFVWAKRRYDRT